MKSLKKFKGKVQVAESLDDGDLYHVESADNDFVENHSRWVLDSAADVHVCKDQAMFTTLQKDGDFGCINMRKKLKLKVEGIGRVRLKLHSGKVRNIPNVRCVSTTNVNIISLGKMTSHGYKYVGIGKTCKGYKENRLILQG